MAINTLVIWPLGHTQSEEVEQTIFNEVLRLKEQGLTTSFFFESEGGIKRTWATREAAQGWIDFLNSLDVKPESAVIVEE